MTEADRRPIAARRLRPVVATADWLIRRGASPNAISIAGMVAAIGALRATSVLIAAPIFHGTALDSWVLRLGLGAIVSTGGKAGDLMLSFIKRD